MRLATLTVIMKENTFFTSPALAGTAFLMGFAAKQGMARLRTLGEGASLRNPIDALVATASNITAQAKYWEPYSCL